MKLEDYPIDELHLMACAEFDDDEDALNVLNSVYEAQLRNYVAAMKLLRFRRQRAAS